MMSGSPKKPHADGQREQYGNGKDYREADLTEAADNSSDHGSFAVGQQDSKPTANKKRPAQNDVDRRNGLASPS